MNEKEKKDFYVAMCNCCLIAQAMKRCPACLFNVGIAEQPEPADSSFLKGIVHRGLDIEEPSMITVPMHAA